MSERAVIRKGRGESGDKGDGGAGRVELPSSLLHSSHKRRHPRYSLQLWHLSYSLRHYL